MTDSQWSDALLDEELSALYMSPATFKEISAGAGLLTDLGLAETKFLFEAALQHGEYLNYWFNRLQAAGGEAASWTIIEDKIANEAARFEQAENAVRLLGEINDAQALEYLKKALQQDALAPAAIQVLATMRTKDALAILEEELHQERLADLVIDSLSQLRSREAVNLIGLALREKILAPHPEMALNRISKSRTHPSAKQAAEILDAWQRGQEKATETRALEYPNVTRGEAGLKDRDWEIIIRRIKDGKCTPLLGPDSSSKYFPSLATIAQKWAGEYGYPFENNKDFPSVSEFLAVLNDWYYPNARLGDIYQGVPQPDPVDPTNSIALLADLPLSIYITTTYDDMLVRALRYRHRGPVQEVCLWNKNIPTQSSSLEQGFSPTVANPVVFHLFGHVGIPESLVLTTRDYLTLLINVSKDISLIPLRIQRALTASTILFLGFDFSELSARVLFTFVDQFLKISFSKPHVAVLRPPYDLAKDQQARAEDYLDRYFRAGDVRTYKRPVEEFCEELRQRWQASSYES